MSSKEFLATVLADADKAGVYHLPHTDKRTLVAAAKSAGLASFRVDLAAARTKVQMLAAIAKAMAFPQWHGQNLDALADCLGDLSWRPAEGYLVILEHCDAVHGACESDFLACLEVFAQAATEWREQAVPLWCLVEMQADGIAWLPSGP